MKWVVWWRRQAIVFFLNLECKKNSEKPKINPILQFKN